MKPIECKRRGKSVFSNRLKGLKKKIFELSTLCGTDAVMVCVSSDGDHFETWPDKGSEVVRIIKRYKDKKESVKNNEDIASLYEKKVKNLQQKLDQKRIENAGLLYPSRDDRLDNFSQDCC
ncbi:uncharacterized protein LOC143856986 [Tasmannia lanceolata]|uniref:uncharacterized protein LOC143856986 n=1 Tax=Tasmannia lanceolata TaxID=3420 RepID=UPI0040642A8F